jgi:hypothetical protein
MTATNVEVREHLRDALLETLDPHFEEILEREGRLSGDAAYFYLQLPRATAEEKLRALTYVEERARQDEEKRLAAWQENNRKWRDKNCKCGTCLTVFHTTSDLAAHKKDASHE